MNRFVFNLMIDRMKHMSTRQSLMHGSLKKKKEEEN
jgi:hypothetical protein